MTIELSVNGQRVVADGDPHISLLHFLRERGLTGTKEGCAEGECGACAVVVVQRDPLGNTQYRPVNSCLVLVGSMADQEILTVEGVAHEGALHPVQDAMVRLGGSQCGYCTPGFIMSLFAEYYRADRSGYDPEAISGNLCRCTGYRPIRDAAKGLPAPSPDDPFKKRLQLAPPALPSRAMESFFRPTALAEALKLLADHPDAVLVAGGTDLVVEMNQFGRRFANLVSLEAVAELSRVTWHDDALLIGAGVPLTEVEHHVRSQLPLLEGLFPLFSSRLIRNRATLGGNLVTASPIGDGPPALLALNAEVEITSLSGVRRVALSEFFTGYRKTRLERGEILSAVRIPRPFPQLSRFYKVSKRTLDDISTVAAAFAIDLDDAGNVEAARLAFGGVAATPIRAKSAEDFLLKKPWNVQTVNDVSRVLAESFTPIDDHRGSARYRLAMVPKLFEKFFEELAGGKP